MKGILHLRVCIGQVGLSEGDFLTLTHHGGLNPWVGQFFITIIIKLSRKKYKYKYIKKTQRLVSMQLLKGKQYLMTKQQE